MDLDSRMAGRDLDAAFEARFRQALAENRLPHAFLLVASDESRLRDRCHCLIDAIAGGADLARDGNIFHLAPANRMGQIAIDEIRTIRHKLSQSSLNASRRVVWIERADGLQRPGANALLKILEEPPQGTTFFLTTTRPYDLLDTVRSRCLRWNFRGAGAGPTIEKWPEWCADFTSFLHRRSRSNGSPLVLEAYVLMSNFQWILDRQEAAAEDQPAGRRLLRDQLLTDLERLILESALELLPPAGAERRRLTNWLAAQMAAIARARQFLALNGSELAAIESIFRSLLVGSAA